MDLPSPISTLITLLPYLLSSPPTSVPSHLLSSPVLQSHLYLNHSPSSPSYLQSISKPSIVVSERLNVLLENAEGVEVGRIKWRIELDGEIKTKILICLENNHSESDEGLEVVFLWEEDKTGMVSMGLEDEPQHQEPSWGFLNLIESTTSSSTEDDGYSTSLELAVENLNKRLVPRSIKPPSSTVQADGEGTTPGAYGVAEDFWDGWEEEEGNDVTEIDILGLEEEGEVINRSLQYSEEAVRREENERYGISSSSSTDQDSTTSTTAQESLEAALQSRYDLPSTSSSSSSSQTSYTASPPKSIPSPTATKSSYEAALQSRYDIPSTSSSHYSSSSYPSPPNSNSNNPYHHHSNNSHQSLQEDEETGLSNVNYWNSYGSVESAVGEEEDTWGGRNRIHDTSRRETVEEKVEVITRSRRSSTIRPPDFRTGIVVENGNKNGALSDLINKDKDNVVVEVVVDESEAVLKAALEGIWKLYSIGNSSISVEKRKENWLKLTGKVIA